MREELEALAAEIIARERERTAMAYDEVSHSHDDQLMLEWAHKLRALAAKCDAAPPAPVVGVPDEMFPSEVPAKWFRTDASVQAYMDGWNACRAEMLRTAPTSAPDRDAVDAARYRWLRKNLNITVSHWFFTNGGSELDEAIDAECLRALKSEPQG